MFLDSNRLVFKISGNDRFKFLQGLITQDISLLEKNVEPAIYTALLSPNGRYQFDFFIVNDAPQSALWVVAMNAEALLKKIKPYKLRLDVTIEPYFDVLRVYGSFTQENTDGVLSFQDPRHPSMPFWTISKTNIDLTQQYGDYVRHRLGLGIPDSDDFEYDRSIVLEWGFEELKGISFDKGCYMGQELMSRTKHVGEIRKRLLPCQLDDIHGPVSVGDSVLFENKEVGVVKAIGETLALLLVRTGHLPLENSTVPVVVGKEKAVIYKPDWFVF